MLYGLNSLAFISNRGSVTYFSTKLIGRRSWWVDGYTTCRPLTPETVDCILHNKCYSWKIMVLVENLKDITSCAFSQH